MQMVLFLTVLYYFIANSLLSLYLARFQVSHYPQVISTPQDSVTFNFIQIFFSKVLFLSICGNDIT